MRVTRFASMRAYVLLLVAAGVATGSIALILAGAVPLVFVLHGTLTTAPVVGENIRVKRTLSPKTPLPGQSVAVTLTIENICEQTIPDLRIIDGVPDELGVTDGSPKASGAVSAGGSLSYTYTLQADRGTYAFDDVAIRARNSNGTRLVDEMITPDCDTEFECRVDIEDIPVQQTTTYTGQLPTDSGGPGIEFYSTRDHHPEDPVKRIDWRTYAKTGELATIEFREQHAAHVAVLTDSRQPAHVAADATSPTGATLSAYAATIALDVLINEGHEVSLGALGITDPETGVGPPVWVGSDEGTAFTAHATTVCNAAATGIGENDPVDEDTNEPADRATEGSTSPAEAASTTDGGQDWGRIRSLVPTGAQVVLCTPATDGQIIPLVELLRGDGHEVTVLTPQTAPKTIGGRTVALQRAVRLERLRFLGATVIDWDSDEKLRVTLSRTLGVS